MTRVIQSLEGSKPSLLWIERVASFSNPADDPSRGRGAHVAEVFGGVFVEQPLIVDSQVVDAIVKLTKSPFPVVPECGGAGNTASKKVG